MVGFSVTGGDPREANRGVVPPQDAVFGSKNVPGFACSSLLFPMHLGSLQRRLNSKRPLETTAPNDG